jgi:tetratricopeptide (TPR) repeat protein
VLAPALPLGAATGATTAAASVANPVYLFGPALDLSLIAGGISLVALPLIFLVSAPTGALAFVVLNLVANYPHYMATNYRVYGSRAQLHRYKFFAVYVTGFVGLTAVLSHVLVGSWIIWVVNAYALWTPYHYVGQNYGIAVMYAGRGRVGITPGEKWILYLALVASMLTYLLLLLVRPAGTGLTLAALSITPDTVRIVYVVLVTLGLAAAGGLAWRLSRRASLRTLTPILLLTGVHFLWFSTAPALLLFRRQLSLTGLDLQLFVPALAFLHSAQYLGVTAYYTQRERARMQKPFRMVPYLVTLLVGGVLLWPVMIRGFSQLFVVDYAFSVMVLNALINIHHFILDGAIWKLRDGRIARLLIPEETAAAPVPAAAAAIGDTGGYAPAVATSPGWWSGIGGRIAVAAIVCVALAIHGSDVVRVSMLLKATALRQAQKWKDAGEAYRSALTLNGRVADAIEGLAVSDMQAGEMQRAAEHWAESVRLNPLSAHLRSGLGETYLKLGRLDDALAQLEEAVRLAPTDTTALMLLSRVYGAKGDTDKAKTLVERARAAANEAEKLRLAL